MTFGKKQETTRWLPLISSFCVGMIFMIVIQSCLITRTDSTVRQLLRQKRGLNGVEKGKLASTILQFGDPGTARDFFEREEYVISYDRRDRVASWVGEHLTAASLVPGEGVNRDHSKFQEDPDVLPIFRSTLADYSGSGYDRGHMAPAGDAVFNQTAMDQTFYLSNMSPQVGIGFNRHYWAYFESFARNLTQSFSDVYVLTGPLFLPQPSDKDSKKYTMTYPVLNGNVAVPTHFYKVILVPDGKKKDSYAFGAFVLPNQSIPSDTDLTKFKVTLDVVEKASGLIFFDKLDAKSLGDLCSITTCSVKPFHGS
ncbi:uncharacterized protein BX664DRAFT_328884 [Halteromyces radiatus]|uniref:uncharacterized protein n=1 Tax=Halteromyces radiatus TaxID=101107 RepID=UPI00221F006C|nr:uncharacterized protein BX664DRAFT_328884 [Halteromyces radiatus]KAI8093083.1 hypothetical protein BX664DRAFT_328884 [Halteromyces radiatus]